MNHKEYRHIVDRSSCAILFIHGILGTPDHFDFLIQMVPSNVSVHNLLLDGHGKGVRDFSRTSMKRWENQVHDAVTALQNTHERVYIVGHSMGTLFAIHEAITEPQIKGLFLLAVPICPFPRREMFINALKVYSGRLSDDDRYGHAAKAACSITQSKNLLLYVPWIFRYFELFLKIAQTRRILPALNTPCVAFQSIFDEMVSPRSINLLRKKSNAEIQILDQSHHYLYSEKDQALICEYFQQFIEHIK